MRFGPAQELMFGTDHGSYSTVTDREEHDSQITLDGDESDLAVAYFGRRAIHVGNVASAPELALKSFRLYPDGEQVRLNLVYPKPDSGELRLYLSFRAGFRPTGGEIWFLFEKDGDLWIGSMREPEWRARASDVTRTDASDEAYQRIIHEPETIQVSRVAERDVYARSRAVAQEAMRRSGFRCQFGEDHALFHSRASGLPYLEVHHLVPMGMQSTFDKPLDVVLNVFSLCPWCHSAVHHADARLARDILSSLADKNLVLDHYSLERVDLFALYGVEEID